MLKLARGNTTVTGSIQLRTAVKKCVLIAVKMVTFENIIIAKFEMRKNTLTIQECRILGSNPGVSHVWTGSLASQSRGLDPFL